MPENEDRFDPDSEANNQWGVSADRVNDINWALRNSNLTEKEREILRREKAQIYAFANDSTLKELAVLEQKELNYKIGLNYALEIVMFLQEKYRKQLALQEGSLAQPSMQVTEGAHDSSGNLAEDLIRSSAASPEESGRLRKELDTMFAETKDPDTKIMLKNIMDELDKSAGQQGQK